MNREWIKRIGLAKHEMHCKCPTACKQNKMTYQIDVLSVSFSNGLAISPLQSSHADMCCMMALKFRSGQGQKCPSNWVAVWPQAIELWMNTESDNNNEMLVAFQLLIQGWGWLASVLTAWMAWTIFSSCPKQEYELCGCNFRISYPVTCKLQIALRMKL